MGSRDGNADGNLDVLERIVALLFALAGLAEMAAGLPFFRRREVLEILGDGEAAARVCFAGMAAGASSEEDAYYDGAPADAPEVCRDASMLASRFRALGFMLVALLTLADLSAPPRAAFPPPGVRVPVWPAHRKLAIPARRHDLPP